MAGEPKEVPTSPQPEKSSGVRSEPTTAPLRAHFNIIRESWRRWFPKPDSSSTNEVINQAVDRNKISGEDAQRAKADVFQTETPSTNEATAQAIDQNKISKDDADKAKDDILRGSSGK